MGADYALVHLHWNIPPALVLSFVYYPLLTALDVYKIVFLIIIAVTATIPWDSYLIRHNVWSYPPEAVLGPTLFGIPAEELFFFVIQTYNTSLLYCLLSKPTFHSTYLHAAREARLLQVKRWVGAALIAAWIGLGAWMIRANGQGLYMGLIVVWAGPFCLLLWTLAYQFILSLPLKDKLVPIVVPTLYLWLVDTLALRRGTWVIEDGTKLNWQLWEGLEIEEATFFLATNLLIVFGLIAFDNSIAILTTFPDRFRDEYDRKQEMPTPALKVRALLMSPSNYDEDYLSGLRQALTRLRDKSRSFYAASGVFPARMRIDLILLYSFCRVADDLIDEETSAPAASQKIKKLRSFLDFSYSRSHNRRDIERYVTKSFPEPTHSAFLLLPTYYLPSKPLYSLLDGFETDLKFGKKSFPMESDQELLKYAAQVAGTVAWLCIVVVLQHSATPAGAQQWTKSFDEISSSSVMRAGEKMGIALQLVNIARDIQTDALLGRVYIPTSRLNAYGLSPQDILGAYKGEVLDIELSSKIEAIRKDLLEWALGIYRVAKIEIGNIPKEARGGFNVMVESYVEIGRVMLKEDGKGIHWGKNGRATVPKWKRLWVAWRAMIGR